MLPKDTAQVGPESRVPIARTLIMHTPPGTHGEGAQIGPSQ